MHPLLCLPDQNTQLTQKQLIWQSKGRTTNVIFGRYNVREVHENAVEKPETHAGILVIHLFRADLEMIKL